MMQVEEGLNGFMNQNNVLTDSQIYHFDQKDIDDLNDEKLWEEDPKYFKNCHISINAVIKMLTHACLGKNNEVMGMMQGSIRGDTFIIFDVLQLHGQASETTVRLDNESMADLMFLSDKLDEVGRPQPKVGWYHSHPNYGCWLSGTDVKTQEIQQRANGAFVAVVIDPIRSMMGSRVDIGAFRTYPPEYDPQEEHQQGDSDLIPEQKIKDFGAHHNRYYSLNVQLFCNSMDKEIIGNLWNQYWGVRMAQSSLWENRKKQFFHDNLEELKGKCHKYYLEQQTRPNNATQNTFPKELVKFTSEYSRAVLQETIKNMIFQ